MKNIFVIIILFYSYGFCLGQKNEILKSRTSDNVEILDFTGFTSTCQSGLEDVAGEIKSLMESGNHTVNITIAKIYPPSVYMKKEDGINAMISITKETIANRDSNYILIIASGQEGGLLNEVTLHYKLKNQVLSTKCYKNKGVVMSKMATILSEKVAGGTKEMSKVECYVKEMFDSFKSILNNDCDVNSDDVAKYLKSVGFYEIPLGTLDIDYGQPPTFKNDIEDLRNYCHLIDYTKGQLKINNEAITNFLNVSSINSITPKRIIISSYQTFLSPTAASNFTLESVVEAEILHEFPACDIVTMFHFPGTLSNGKDYVYIGVKIDETPGSFTVYNYQQLYEMANNNGPGALFENFVKINFKAKDLGLAAAQFLKDNNHIPFNGLSHAKLEFSAGLFCGIVDGLLETINVIGMVSQFSYHYVTNIENAQEVAKFVGTKNAMCLVFADVISHAVQKQSWEQGIKAKYQADIEFTKDFNTIVTSLSALTAEQICNFVMKIVGDTFKDLTLQNGTFQAGYTVGIGVFEIISNVLIPGKVMATALTAAMKNAAKLLSAFAAKIPPLPPGTITIIRNMVKASFTALETLIANMPKLRTWYYDKMPSLIKGRLDEFATNSNLTQFVAKLEADLGSMPQLKTWLNQKGVNGLDSWRYLEEAFPEPNRIWCIP